MTPIPHLSPPVFLEDFGNQKNMDEPIAGLREFVLPPQSSLSPLIAQTQHRVTHDDFRSFQQEQREWQEEMMEREQEMHQKMIQWQQQQVQLMQMMIKKMEKAEEHKLLENPNQVIRLNVGGETFATSLSTLRKKAPNQPEHMLATMFSGKFKLTHDRDGCVFIDRDGSHFGWILNYLRNDFDFSKLSFPSGVDKKGLKAELDYFLLSKMHWILQDDDQVVPINMKTYKQEKAEENKYTERRMKFSVNAQTETLQGQWRVKIPDSMQKGRFAFIEKESEYDSNVVTVDKDSDRWVQPDVDGWMNIPTGDCFMIYSEEYECNQNMKSGFAHGYQIIAENCPFTEVEFELLADY